MVDCYANPPYELVPEYFHRSHAPALRYAGASQAAFPPGAWERYNFGNGKNQRNIFFKSPIKKHVF